jgi:nicotinamidase-related amidase
VVLEKSTYSPFVSTDLERILGDEGITRLYITGLHTDCCARHTSGDAFQKGFDLVWVTDVLQAFTQEAHEAGLEYFKTWYASDVGRQFRTADEVIEEWARADWWLLAYDLENRREIERRRVDPRDTPPI